ncbi:MULTISPECIES: hypothetical protein [Burkholderia]|nr:MULTISPECIES: hypothetical protein [Burkholderia]
MPAALAQLYASGFLPEVGMPDDRMLALHRKSRAAHTWFGNARD